MGRTAKKLKGAILFSILVVLMFSFPAYAFAEGDTDGSDPEGLAISADSEQAIEAEASDISESDIPLGVRPYETGWSVISLCASLLAIVIGVVLVTLFMVRKNSSPPQLSNNFGLAVFAMIAAIISTVLFTSTEEIQSQMILADSFTVAHIAILAVSLLCLGLSLRKEARASLSDKPSVFK
jgi:small basic protein